MAFGEAKTQGFNNGEIVVATKIIVFGPGEGVFVYNGTPGLGNPPQYSLSNSSTDPFGNAIDVGDASYAGGGAYVRFFLGILQFLAAGGFAPATASPPNPGELKITSGAASAGDTQASVTLYSQKSAFGEQAINLNAVQLFGAVNTPQGASPFFPIASGASLATVITSVNDFYSRIVSSNVIS